MNKNIPLRVAVIGIGAFGELHCQTLAALAEAELVAMVGPSRSQMQTLANELGVPHVFTSLRELLESGCADALVIATRTDSHVPLAQEALAGGLHVLVEKPVGATAAEVAELASYYAGSDRVVMAGHICLFHSLTAPLIERVRREKWRAAHFVRHRPAETARIYPEEHPYRMTMIHDLYVLAQMADNEEPVEIDGFDAQNAAGQSDMSWAALRWEDGRVATLQSHWTLPAGAPADGWDATEVFGPTYHAEITTGPRSGTWTQDKMGWPQSLEISQIAGRPTGMLAEELRSFIAACNGDEVPPGCRLSDALQVQRWVERLMHSAESKRVQSNTNEYRNGHFAVAV